MYLGERPMIAVSAELKALLLNREPHRVFDLWTFALTGGIALRWTSADIDLTVGGHAYLSQVNISRDKCKLTAGIETATQQVTISPDADSEPLIGGVPMRQAIRCGLFDGASARLEWAYYDLSFPPVLVGTILRFTGFVGDIDVYAAKATLTVDSPLKRLDLQIPWKAYGAGWQRLCARRDHRWLAPDRSCRHGNWRDRGGRRSAGAGRQFPFRPGA